MPTNQTYCLTLIYFATEQFSESEIFATVAKCPLLMFPVLFLCIGPFGVATIDCRSDDDDNSERLITDVAMLQ
jgi:hypothetical protein